MHLNSRTNTLRVSIVLVVVGAAIAPAALAQCPREVPSVNFSSSLHVTGCTNTATLAKPLTLNRNGSYSLAGQIQANGGNSISCGACVDGLKGLPEAIESVYPRTEVQLCIVHLVRASLNYVNWKQRKEVAGDLRLIYQAGTVLESELRRDDFAAKWDASYPMVSQIWRRNWERIVPFFAYPRYRQQGRSFLL